MHFNKKIIFLLFLISNNNLFATVGESMNIYTDIYYTTDKMNGVFLDLSAMIQSELPTIKDLEENNYQDFSNVEIGSQNSKLFPESSLFKHIEYIKNLKLFFNNFDIKKNIISNFELYRQNAIKKDWFLVLGLLRTKRILDEPSFKVILGVSHKNERNRILSLFEVDRYFILENKTKEPLLKDRYTDNHIRLLIKHIASQYGKENNFNQKEIKMAISMISVSNMINIINSTFPSPGAPSRKHIGYVIHKAIFVILNNEKEHLPIPYNERSYKLHTEKSENEVIIATLEKEEESDNSETEDLEATLGATGYRETSNPKKERSYSPDIFKEDKRTEYSQDQDKLHNEAILIANDRSRETGQRELESRESMERRRIIRSNDDLGFRKELNKKRENIGMIEEDEEISRTQYIPKRVPSIKFRETIQVPVNPNEKSIIQRQRKEINLYKKQQEENKPYAPERKNLIAELKINLKPNNGEESKRELEKKATELEKSVNSLSLR